MERYKGKHALGLYRWDPECLLDVMDMALTDTEEYPSPDTPGNLALEALNACLRAVYEAAYGKDSAT